MKGNRKYRRDFPHRIYVFFSSYSDSGLPSFQKFARSIGVTSEDVESFREHKEFERAYRECAEIRRDYLIDNALSKRFDSSFAKFLLQSEAEGSATEDGKINFTLKVLDENGA